MKKRDTRQEVSISVRFVADDSWSDAVVRNVSNKGLMAKSPCPPKRGSYAEIRRGSYSIVGRVIWSADDRFGLQAQDNIVLADLSRPRPKHKPQADERREQPRDRRPLGRPPPNFEEKAEASARLARKMNFMFVIMLASTFAFLLASQAASMLASPLGTIQETLKNAARR